MKTVKILFFIFCISFSFAGNAQTDNKDIIKVSYTGGCVSDFLVGLLKDKVQDAFEYTRILEMMEGYKIHSSFYHNTRTKESIFVLDSVIQVDQLSTTGYTHSVYKNTEGQIFGREIFMGKNIDFKGNINELNWEITDEQKEISGYNCKKALLKDNPQVSVWFTPEIAVSGGPYTFFGLPGLVLETDSPFESNHVNGITYASLKEFQAKIKDAYEGDNYDQAISLAEVFAKKENFQRMVANN